MIQKRVRTITARAVIAAATAAKKQAIPLNDHIFGYVNRWTASSHDLPTGRQQHV
jgi:hypothetical protein